MQETHVDNLIIGAGLVGSMTARMLARKGERGVLIDRSREPGGVNGSFTDGLGNWFDHGRHIINPDRSEFAREFVTDVLDGQLRRFDLQRSVVVRGHCIPDAAGVDAWPEALRRRIRVDPSVSIALGSRRAEFARAYGPWLADLAFDEMLRAYPTLCWRRARGTPEHELMQLIFPWFFPRTAVEAPPRPRAEQGVYSEESRRYHYRCRHADPPREAAMYPVEGGFGRLIHAMLEDSRDHFDVRLGVEGIELEVDPGALAVRRVTTPGRAWRAERVFWCAPLPVLCKYLDWPLPAGEPQWELLGSFTFRDPVPLRVHEVLFADPDHKIRRVNNPGRIAGRQASTALQVEYTTLGDEARRGADEWRDCWLASLRRLGFVDADNPVAAFDFKRLSRGIVSTSDLGAFLRECEDRIAAARGNLVAPHLAVASDNNARLIPKVFERVDAALRGA